MHLGARRIHSGLPVSTPPISQRFEPASPDAGEHTSAPGADETTVVIRLALDAEGHPCGTLRHGNSQPARFAGWLGLMAEVSAAIGPRGPHSVDNQ